MAICVKHAWFDTEVECYDCASRKTLMDMNTEDFNTMREMLSSIEMKIIQLDPMRQRQFYKTLQNMIFEAWQDACNTNDAFLFTEKKLYRILRYDTSEPALITSEILEKCGFVNILGDVNYWNLPVEKCIGGWSEKFSYYLPYFGLNTYTGNITVKYLHQLQNLYFALTGQELNTTRINQ